MRDNKVVDITLLSNCNFKCEYCISGSHLWSYPINTNDDGYLNIIEDERVLNGRKNAKVAREKQLPMNDREYIEIVKNTGNFRHQFLDLDILYDYIRTHLSDWTIALSGGEPLLYPKIDEFITKLVKTNKVILLTNLSLIKNHMELIDLPNLFFRVGYHPQERSSRHFTSVVDILKFNHVPYIVNYVLHPSHVESGEYLDHIKVLDDNDFEYEITRFEGTWKGEEYDKHHDLKEWEKEILSSHIMSPINVSADEPGQTYLAIKAEGTVFECHDYRVNMGNVYDNTLNLEPISKEGCIGCDNKCPSMVSQENIFENVWNI